MAVTVPVGLAAPKLLFAETAEQLAAETLIIITDGKAGPAAAIPSHYREISIATISAFSFDKGSFLIVDNSGNKMRATKLVFSGKVSLKEDMQHILFPEAPEVKVEFGEGRKSPGLLSLRSYQLPQYHVRKAENFRKENLEQFLAKKRAGVLRLV